MKVFLMEVPLLRVLLPFMGGIGVMYYFQANSLWVLCITLILLGVLLRWRRLPAAFRLVHAHWGGILLMLTWLGIGMSITGLQQQAQFRVSQGPHKLSNQYLLCRVDEAPKPGNRSVRISVQLIKTIQQPQQVLQGRGLIYLAQGSKANKMAPGQYLVIKALWKPLVRRNIPGNFEYADYAARQGWFVSAYVSDSQWFHTPPDALKWQTLLWQTQQNVLARISRSIPDPKARGLAEALLIGYRQDIDLATWDIYARSGVVHIIAISGMHMVMVSGSLTFLLNCVPFFKRKKRMTYLLSLIGMWLFACLTGLPASVLRAAWMLTLLSLGNCLNKSVQTLNTLAASAILLFCWNPLQLFDAGCQLSYLAVLGLILIQPFFNRIWNPVNKLLKGIWILISTSVSAQVFTFPLSLYYFHQFPLAFLAANLIAIPVTTFCLYAEILLFALADIPLPAHHLGNAISITWNTLTDLMYQITCIPGISLQGLYPDVMQIMLMYGLILLICSLVWNRNRGTLYRIMLLLCVWQLFGSYRDYRQHTQRGWIFYYQKRQLCGIVYSGQRFALIRDSKSAADTPAWIKPCIGFLGLKYPDSGLRGLQAGNWGWFVSMQGRRLLCLRRVPPLPLNALSVNDVILHCPVWTDTSGLSAIIGKKTYWVTQQKNLPGKNNPVALYEQAFHVRF